MSIETLQAELKIVETDLAQATEKFNKIKNGPAKVQMGETVEQLKSRKAGILKEISALPENEVSVEQKVNSSAKGKSISTNIDDYKTGDRIVVKNNGLFMLSDGKGVRFSPGIEMTTVVTDYIRGQVEANIFVILAK